MKKYKNKTILLSLIILFLIGLALGISFIFIFDDASKMIISKELNEYIQLVNDKNTNYFYSFWNSFKINFTYISLIWSIGILFFFIPITYFIIFYKGFLLGFLLSGLILTFKIKGILLFLLSIFPHEIINILSIILISIISIKFGKNIFKNIKLNIWDNMKHMCKNYVKMYLIFFAVTIISSLLEVFINSFLLRVVI